MSISLDRGAIQHLRRGLKTQPPRTMHSQLPFSTQLAVVDYHLELCLVIEGVQLANFKMPSATLPLELLVSIPKHHMVCWMDEEAFDIDMEAINTTCEKLLQHAHKQSRLFTDDEADALKAVLADNYSGSPFAIRAAENGSSEKSNHQYSDVMSSTNLMESPKDLLRMIRRLVSNSFAVAADSNTILRDTTITLSVEVLKLQDERPFHLQLYLETLSANEFDWEAWQRYQHLLHVRARRQAAAGAFYGSLRALQQEEPVADSPKRLWKARRAREKKQKAALECDRLKELRSRLDMAKTEKTIQLGHRQQQQEEQHQS